MAANLQQMAAAGQLLPQQRALAGGRSGNQAIHQIVYNSVLQDQLPHQSWQTTVQLMERVGKATNLITNLILAMPQENWQKSVTFGISFEKSAFLGSPDKVSRVVPVGSHGVNLPFTREKERGTCRDMDAHICGYRQHTNKSFKPS